MAKSAAAALHTEPKEPNFLQKFGHDFVHGDIFTKLSFFVWGLGYIGHGQLMKALLVTFVQGFALYFLAFFGVSKEFFVKTLICVTFQSVCLTAIKIPLVPIIDDTLSACIIGGIVAGGGTGIALRAGASGGGQDILGVYFTRKLGNFSVGKMGLIINFIVYGICLFMFDISVVIYSVIYTVVLSMTLDLSLIHI